MGMGPVTLCWCTRDVNFLRLQGVGGDVGMESVTLCWCTCGVCYLAETARCLCGCVDGVCDIMLMYMW